MRNLFKKSSIAMAVVLSVFMLVQWPVHNVSAETTPVPSPIVEMDPNNDGIINDKDLEVIASYYNTSSSDSNWNYELDYNSDNQVDLLDMVRMGRQYGKSVPVRTVITIDAGHGSFNTRHQLYDSGAVGPTGLRERDVVLDISLKVGAILTQNNIKVIYTRTTEFTSWTSDIDLLRRCEISNNANAEYFVSIHNNAFYDASVNGVETFHYPGNIVGQKLAEAIQSRLYAAMNGVQPLRNRGVKSNDFTVLEYTKAHAALTEIGFITNPNQEALLRDPSYRDMCARAIAEGILQFLSDIKKSTLGGK